MSNTQQADSELHEDQLLNFLVNTLDQEVALDLAAKDQINAQDIYKILVGACADGTSISTLCNPSKSSPAANTVLYHLRTKFEPKGFERVANVLLRRDIVELLPGQVEVCADLHCGLTMEIKPTQTASITRKPNVEQRRFMPTLYARVTN